jgi:hypothetical protein
MLIPSKTSGSCLRRSQITFSDGSFDPAVHRIREAWVRATEWNDLKKVGKTQRRRVGFKQWGQYR